MEHLVRRATEEEAKVDCCGDRYNCYVALVCSCGETGCNGCISSHIMALHRDVEAEKKRQHDDLIARAKDKLAAITPEERKVLGI